MKTYIRRQQLKNIKHQDMKQKEPPQKYRLGTIINKTLLAGLKCSLGQFYCHKQLTFDVAPMYKVHLSDTLITILVLHV